MVSRVRERGRQRDRDQGQMKGVCKGRKRGGRVRRAEERELVVVAGLGGGSNLLHLDTCSHHST